MAAHDRYAFQIAVLLIHYGANCNHVAQFGQTALAEAVIHDNRKLVEMLLKYKSDIFIKDLKHRDVSPFFEAVKHNKLWAIEMFCDQGADINT